MSTDPAPAAAYAASAVVEVEGPPKRPDQTERLLYSLRVRGDLAPLIFVGSSDGTLRSYVVDGRAGVLRWQAEYKRLYHACSVVLDSWGVLVTLTDNRVKLVHLPLQSTPQAIDCDDSKGAVLLAAHEEAKTLIVLLKTNMLKVFDWTVHRMLASRAQHNVLPSLLPVQQLVLLSEHHVFVRGKKQWAVLDLDSGRALQVETHVKQDISEALEGSVGVCDALALPSRVAARRQQHVLDLLLCGTHHGVILTICDEAKSVDPDESRAFDDKATTMDKCARLALDVATSQLSLKVDRKLALSTTPRNAYYHHPFLLLDQGDHMSVYNYGSLRLVQSLLAKAPYSFCATFTSASATAEDSSVQEDRLATLYTVSSHFLVHAHHMLPIARQVAAAIGNGCREDAVALCKLCPGESLLSNAEQQKLYADYGFDLFRSKSRQQAMQYFDESDIDVIEVVLLFPRHLLPRKYSALHKDSSTSKNDILEGDDLVDSLLALIGFLRCKRNAQLRWGEKSLAITICDGDDVNLNKESALELIDTMLVKCLVVVGETTEFQDRAKRALLEVVSSRNWCEISEVEIYLRAHRRFKALLAFYSARKLHRKALELLEDLERSAASINAPSDANASRHREDVALDTNDLLSSHDCMVLTAQYLRGLGRKHAELVFEFSQRVLSVNAALGLSIFTQRDTDSRQDIDPAAVLQHIKCCVISADETLTNIEHDDAGATSSSSLPLVSSQMLAIEYLTQIIYEGSCHLTPRLHDEVVYMLLDAITAKSLQDRLTSRVESQRGMTGLLRRKLLEFLEFPGALFHPERMLSRTPTEMVDEHAALLSKLGRHLEVLQLYALKLQDAALAEAYCNCCFESKTADSSIYSTLLKIYLRPQHHTASSVVESPPQPSWDTSFSSHLHSEAIQAAINLLNKHAERIDVSSALELLPTVVPVAVLTQFFRRVLERQVERFRNGQVKKQLSKMENFNVREQLSTKRKESVTVWSSQCCQSCGRKLGVGTFVRFPGGLLLHYSCSIGRRVA